MSTAFRFGIIFLGGGETIKFPICDLTYTRKGYIAEPWYSPAVQIPDEWLAAIQDHYEPLTDDPPGPNYLGESPLPNSYLIWCEIIDIAKMQALLLDEERCPPLVCVPDVFKYTDDPAYRAAVDAYNKVVVRFALKRKGENAQCTEWETE